jgi:hypothetical protein
MPGTEQGGNSEEQTPATTNRRSFLTKAALGAGAAWAAPTLLSGPASAGPGTRIVTGLGGSAATANSGIFGGDATVTVTRTFAVTTGDLLLAICSTRDNATLGTMTPAWTVIGTPSPTTTGSGTGSVRTYLLRRTVVGGEPANYNFPLPGGFLLFSTITRRVAMAGYSAPVGPVVHTANPPSSIDAAGTAKTFLAAADPGAGGLTVRMGASGGVTSGALAWVAPNPAPSVRVQSHSNSDNGTRCLHISDGPSFAASNGTLNATQPAITYSVPVRVGP